MVFHSVERWMQTIIPLEIRIINQTHLIWLLYYIWWKSLYFEKNKNKIKKKSSVRISSAQNITPWEDALGREMWQICITATSPKVGLHYRSVPPSLLMDHFLWGILHKARKHLGQALSQSMGFIYSQYLKYCTFVLLENIPSFDPWVLSSSRV